MRVRVTVVAALLGVGLSVDPGVDVLRASTPTIAALPADVGTYLKTVGKFTPADLAALEAGTVIANAEQGSTDTEMVTIAAVKIRSARDRTAKYYGDFVSFVDGQVTLGFGRFSRPPALADVNGVTLDADDVAALKACRPGDCDLRISGAGIEKIRSTINWSAADAGTRATAAVRQAMVDYVTAYLARGDEALVTFNDRAEPVSLKDQWRALLANSPAFYQYQPALRDYLAAFPKTPLAGARDVIYWIKENYGRKPVISIVHGVAYQPAAQPDRTTIAQKLIYASHYYDASLAVATIIGATEAGQPVSYVVYGNRSRGDLLKGGLGGLRRSVARDQAKKAAEGTLGTIKTALEK